MGYQWQLGELKDWKWKDMVWNRFTIPKHKFIFWLICKNKIQTKCRLSKWLPIDTQCMLCRNSEETLDHLFCTCTFSRGVYTGIQDWCHYKFEGGTVNEMIDHIQRIAPKKRQRGIAAVFAACLYNIWKCRNQALHNNTLTPTEEAVQWIKYSSSTYLRSKCQLWIKFVRALIDCTRAVAYIWVCCFMGRGGL